MSEPRPPQPGQPPTEMEEALSRISEKNRDMYIKLSNLSKSLSGDKTWDLQNEIIARFNELKAKYPNWQNYEVIHILKGSSLGENPEATEDDLLGENSVKAFVDSLVEKYKS